MFLRNIILLENTLNKSLVLRRSKLKYFGQSRMLSDQKIVENSIQKKLQSALNPVHLAIINESHMHNVPKGSETHFKIVCISQTFENMPLLKRHRMINSLLSHELENGVHALSINAKAPSEWTDNTKVEPSPKCLGGFGK